MIDFNGISTCWDYFMPRCLAIAFIVHLYLYFCVV